MNDCDTHRSVVKEEARRACCVCMRAALLDTWESLMRVAADYMHDHKDGRKYADCPRCAIDEVSERALAALEGDQ